MTSHKHGFFCDIFGCNGVNADFNTAWFVDGHNTKEIEFLKREVKDLRNEIALLRKWREEKFNE